MPERLATPAADIAEVAMPDNSRYSYSVACTRAAAPARFAAEARFSPAFPLRQERRRSSPKSSPRQPLAAPRQQFLRLFTPRKGPAAANRRAATSP